MELNTGMSKSMLTIIVLAAILSLSLFANAFAAVSEENNNDSNKDKNNKTPLPPDAGRIVRAKDANKNGPPPPPGGQGPFKPQCCVNGKKFISIEGGGLKLLGDSENSGSSNTNHHKVKQIDRLFRSNNDAANTNNNNNIPVIPKMNFDVVNGTNSTETATATVTIPVCDGIVPGPCLDKTTGQIIP
jgi:hypothetical protein